MYLLDSDTLVFLLRGSAKVEANFAAHGTDPKALSVVSYGELFYGAMKSAQPIKNAAKVRRISEIIPVIDVSKAIMETFGSLKAGLETEGIRLDDFDVMIASTAIHLNYTLVTNNVRHFERVPDLTVENWTR